MSGSGINDCFEVEADSKVLAPALILASARVGAWAWDRGKGSCLLSPFLAGTTPSLNCLVLVLLVSGILVIASFLNNFFFIKKLKNSPTFQQCECLYQGERVI